MSSRLGICWAEPGEPELGDAEPEDTNAGDADPADAELAGTGAGIETAWEVEAGRDADPRNK